MVQNQLQTRTQLHFIKRTDQWTRRMHCRTRRRLRTNNPGYPETFQRRKCKIK